MSFIDLFAWIVLALPRLGVQAIPEAPIPASTGGRSLSSPKTSRGDA